MRHDWIFDVLTDLHAYACRNDLPALARKLEETVAELQDEVGEAGAAGLPFSRSRRRAN